MIDALIGKIVFDNSFNLTVMDQRLETYLEEQNIALFAYNSPVKNAGGIGKHLSKFSQKVFGLPPYLYLIDDWLNAYQTIISEEKDFKKCKRYDEQDLRLYLLHKVFVYKVANNKIFSKNESVLNCAINIKTICEAHHLVGKAEKYLGTKINPYQLSGTDFEAIHEEIKQLKEGVS